MPDVVLHKVHKRASRGPPKLDPREGADHCNAGHDSLQAPHRPLSSLHIVYALLYSMNDLER